MLNFESQEEGYIFVQDVSEPISYQAPKEQSKIEFRWRQLLQYIDPYQLENDKSLV